jgi:hypothetical protein
MSSAWVMSGQAGYIALLASALENPRAWHTATVLADGKVAIIGGVGLDDKPLSTMEEFDPEQQSFRSVSVTGLAARSRHTATLLSDGSVLIAGGLPATGKALSEVEICDPHTGKITKVPGGQKIPRSDHTAALQPDGTVLIHGGVDSQSNKMFSSPGILLP